MSKKRERAFKGVWIPKEIWLSKELTMQEKLFLAEIDSLDNEKGCFAGNAYFSEFFDLSNGRCSQIIKSLEIKGFVKIKYTYHGQTKHIDQRTIKVTTKYFNVGVNNPKDPLSDIKAPLSDIKAPPLGYDEGNNTVINNTVNNTIIEESDPTESEAIKVEDELAELLLDSICKWDDTHKYNHTRPALKTWAKDLDRAIRIDKRTREQLEWMINYLFIANRDDTNGFWANNIQSGKSLRAKFDQIKNQVKTNQNKNGNNRNESKIDRDISFIREINGN